MADITMCNGIGCSLKDKCYRHTATPNPYRQSYAAFYEGLKWIEVPNNNSHHACEHFVANGAC